MTEHNDNKIHNTAETEGATNPSAPEASRRFEPKVLHSNGQVELVLRQNGIPAKRTIQVESRNFYARSLRSESRTAAKKKTDTSRYIIIGFDTEFKTPSQAVSRETLKAGKAKYTVLSYQVHCKIYDPSQPDCEWKGICYPNDGKRLSLPELIAFAVWKGATQFPGIKIPETIYLVGHFTRADIPALAGFKNELAELLHNIRSTFVSLTNGIHIEFSLDEYRAQSTVILRDTMLLAPEGSKSLKALGELVGVDDVTPVSHPAITRVLG